MKAVMGVHIVKMFSWTWIMYLRGEYCSGLMVDSGEVFSFWVRQLGQ